MTNWEKFKDTLNTTSFSLDASGNLGRCPTTACGKCVFYNTSDIGQCGQNKFKWLNEEYNDYNEVRVKTLRAFQSTLNWGRLCHEVDYCSKCPMVDFRRLFKVPQSATCEFIVNKIISAGFRYFEDCAKRVDDV